MVKIGINGFGRIGRVLTRIIQSRNNLDVVAINDINPDINNIAYLYNYDTTYGKNDELVNVKEDIIFNTNLNINIHHQ